MSEKRQDAVGRRDFLKMSSVAAAAGGAALVSAESQAEASETVEPGFTGYRETDHVRMYYKLARF